jgi:riboflavin synthase
MFSGIITAKEKASRVQHRDNSVEIALPIPRDWKIHLGDSIALDGVCCTVQDLSEKEMSFFLMHETLNKTTFKHFSEDHEINLEQPLTLNALIGGHLVSGHVDTTATVQKIEQDGESKILTFKIDSQWTKYIIYKGSITVNGVSLTIVEVDEESFTVSLIPYTLEHTNLGVVQTNDRVNVELDLLAKYLEKLVKR